MYRVLIKASIPFVGYNNFCFCVGIQKFCEEKIVLTKGPGRLDVSRLGTSRLGAKSFGRQFDWTKNKVNIGIFCITTY